MNPWMKEECAADLACFGLEGCGDDNHNWKMVAWNNGRSFSCHENLESWGPMISLVIRETACYDADYGHS